MLEIKVQLNRVDLDPIEDLIEPVIYNKMLDLGVKDPEGEAEDLVQDIMDKIVTEGAI